MCSTDGYSQKHKQTNTFKRNSTNKIKMAKATKLQMQQKKQ